jgi:hypothetical protein
MIFIIMEKKKFYVYQLKTDEGEIFYIGKGSGKRMFKHVVIANGTSINRGKNPKLYNKISYILKSGGYIIPEIVFESYVEADCHTKEVDLIAEIGIDNLCNLTIGGEGTSGYKLSEETRKKMSEAKKGNNFQRPPLTEEQKAKRRETLSRLLEDNGSYWTGKERSEETKKKMSEAKKGKSTGPISEKRRLAIINGIKQKKSKNL